MASPVRTDPLPKALVVLTAVTGIVDSVSFLGLGEVFTAFMTGNILFLGFAVAGGEGLAPVGSLTALVAFVAGAVFGSRLGVAMGTNRRRWFFISATIATVLLVAAALAAIGLQPVEENPSLRHYPVIALTALAMGLRSATIRRLGTSLNTTLVTGTLVSLIMDSALGRGGGSPRQPYRVAALLAVFAGGAAGTLLLRFGLTVPLLAAAVGVLASVGAYVAHPASRQPAGSPAG